MATNNRLLLGTTDLKDDQTILKTVAEAALRCGMVAERAGLSTPAIITETWSRNGVPFSINVYAEFESVDHEIIYRLTEIR